MKEIILFQNTFDLFALCNIEQDIHHAIRYNPDLKNIPEDENGFFEGTFEIIVKWKPDSADKH